MRSEVRRRDQPRAASPSIWKMTGVRVPFLVSVALLMALAPGAMAGVDVVRENLCELLPRELGGAELGREQRRDFVDCVAVYQLGTPSSDGQSPVHTFDVWVASPQWGDIDGLLEGDKAELVGGSIDIGDEGVAGVNAAEVGPVEEYVVAFRRADLYVHVKTFLGPYEGRPTLPVAELGARSEALARAIDANVIAASGDEPESGVVVPPPSTEDDSGTATPSAEEAQEAVSPQPFDEGGGGIPPAVIVTVVIGVAVLFAANRLGIGTSGTAPPPPAEPAPPPPPGPGRYPRAPGDKAEPRVQDPSDDDVDPTEAETGIGTTG
jgi:hypothetical protein